MITNSPNENDLQANADTKTNLTRILWHKGLILMNNLKLINNFAKQLSEVQNKYRKTSTTYVAFVFFADTEQRIWRLLNDTIKFSSWNSMYQKRLFYFDLLKFYCPLLKNYDSTKLPIALIPTVKLLKFWVSYFFSWP